MNEMKHVIVFSLTFLLFLACNYQNVKDRSANIGSEIQRTIVYIRGNQFFLMKKLHIRTDSGWGIRLKGFY